MTEPLGFYDSCWLNFVQQIGSDAWRHFVFWILSSWFLFAEVFFLSTLFADSVVSSDLLLIGLWILPLIWVSSTRLRLCHTFSIPLLTKLFRAFLNVFDFLSTLFFTLVCAAPIMSPSLIWMEPSPLTFSGARSLTKWPWRFVLMRKASTFFSRENSSWFFWNSKLILCCPGSFSTLYWSLCLPNVFFIFISLVFLAAAWPFSNTACHSQFFS